MAATAPPQVLSEVGRLRACIGCAPGPEFDRMLPRHIEAASVGPDGTLQHNPDYLLFDDLVLREVLAREHQTLFDVVRAATGDVHVHDIRRLLADVLADVDVRAAVLGEVAEQEALLGGELSDADLGWLTDAAPRRCAESVLTGARSDGSALLMWPAPNLLFARDCLAVVGDVVVLMRPRHRARWRDGVVARAIAQHAALFAGATLLDVARESPPTAFLEGGDVLVISPSLVLVGVGMRTNAAGARALAKGLARRGVEVLAVQLPAKRAAMHLDTLFTLVDRDLSLAFMPVVSEQADPEMAVRVFEPVSGAPLPGGLIAVLRSRGHPMALIACGDGDPNAAAREQWTDGANAFCLAPGRILLYGRNRYTLRALNRAGFEITTPAAFIRNAALWLQDSRRLVIALDGFELSRGRGGPRCLTLPIRRDA